ncbi:MAG: sulfate ABC transporter substrate-binding protein [Planctomycetaceae bacterium]
MSTKTAVAVAGILTVAVASIFALWQPGAESAQSEKQVELLNVSYDPTRELWRELNQAFIPAFERDTGINLTIRQSHAGSGSQARAVIDGLDADVVTLALWSDTDALRKQGLIRADWDQQFPHKSLPYFSTIVFVVRKGNPKSIKDWPDLIRPGVSVITPNPKTSGNGKLSFLGAWGGVVARGGSEADARQFVAELYRHAPVLDTGARGATTTFAQKGIGDVHLTWENEAHLEIRESNGALELIYPSVSVRAEPHVAVVDQNVDRKGTRPAAEAYLNFLYTDAGQEIIAGQFYRPINPEVLARHSDRFPPLELVSITAIAADWDAAQTKFFSEGGIFDAIYQPVQTPKAAE